MTSAERGVERLALPGVLSAAEAEATFTELGDRWGEAFAAQSRFMFEINSQGLSKRTEEAARLALARFQALDDQWGVAQAQFSLAQVARLRGDIGGAVAACERALAAAGAGQAELPDLPGDPLVLSHLVAATALLDLDERQALLAAPDGAARLRADLRMLRREVVIVRRLRAVPSPMLTRGPVSPH